MSIPVFLSRPNPVTARQIEFMTNVQHQLESAGLQPKTLGATEYGIDAPLNTIRMLMTESNGLIVVALRRYRADTIFRLRQDQPDDAKDRVYLTSPWCQIEPGMAFQLGMPLLILREKGVLADGVLERGVTGLYLPEADIENATDDYLNTNEWNTLLHDFAGRVRDYRQKRGKP
jgi:hypothetical protein